MSEKRMTPQVIVVVAAVAGTLIAGLLALLTFGAQATVQPDGLPVAVAADGPAAGQVRQAAQDIEKRSDGALEVTATSTDEARKLLYDKDVYGVLEIAASPQGPQATVVTSGAVNPTGTQAAQQALTHAGEGMTAAMAKQLNAAPQPVEVEQVDATGAAAKVAPLAVSALVWIGCMVAGAALTVLAERNGARVGALGRVLTGVTVAVLVTAVLVGYLAWWDSALPLDAEVIGMIALTAVAFAALQGGVFHWLGIKAMAILAPLYLIAPSVAGQVPEMLSDGYRIGLWSWTPFRFPTEALRSLFAGTADAPDVMVGVWVLVGMLAVGLVLLAVPKPARPAIGQEPAESAELARV